VHTSPLSEAWKAQERTDALATTYWQSDLDDSGWVDADPVSQWVVTPGLAGTRGPVVYRCRFAAPRIEPHQRARIRANGVFYYGHYWLDDTYLGDRHGYFVPHEVDATELLRSRDEHLLAAEIECPDQTDRAAKSIITGVFSHWDAIATDFNPGGFWKPVEVVVTGPAYFTHVTVLADKVSPAAATVRARIGIDSDADHTARLTLALVDEESGSVVDAVSTDLTLGEGGCVVDFPLSVAQPKLWWPRRLGPQPMYRLEASLAGPDGVAWDEAERLTGIRELRVRDWQFSVNGERFFVRGANHAPTRMALSEVAEQDSVNDVRLAAEANLDLLRVHAHVAPDSLYEAADRCGMLLWQDFPLQWGYSRRIKRDAVVQARGLVRLLGHHPSVAMWCCHNEPLAVEITDVAEMRPAQMALAAGSMFAPTWNKNRLDPALRRAFEDEDPSRFTDEKSGELPGPLSYGTDTHFYFGWYMGEMGTFARLPRILPKLYRFVSEFGAQALPSAKSVSEMLADSGGADWPEIDWDHLKDRHSAQPALMHRFVPPEGCDSLDSYVEVTQRYQANLLRFHIETLRRLKYRPCGGFAMFQFADSYPAVTWAVLDSEREPKLGYGALRDACADVVVLAAWPHARYRPASLVSLALHVVSELRRPLHGLRLVARLGEEEQEWTGDVEADGVAGCGVFEAAAPPVPGTYQLELKLTQPDGAVLAENCYDIVVD